VQDELEKLTGQRTVPNVFIGACVGSSTRRRAGAWGLVSEMVFELPDLL